MEYLLHIADVTPAEEQVYRAMLAAGQSASVDDLAAALPETQIRAALPRLVDLGFVVPVEPADRDRWAPVPPAAALRLIASPTTTLSPT